MKRVTTNSSTWHHCAWLASTCLAWYLAAASAHPFPVIPAWDL